MLRNKFIKNIILFYYLSNFFSSFQLISLFQYFIQTLANIIVKKS